jgi:ArsR family transcriptional regulator, virulence genes transcriptional regulator
MTGSVRTLEISALQIHAAEAAKLLRLLANEHRLLLLCHLLAEGEICVSALVEAVGLSQSALSQHLARLREDGLVSFRRESQTLYYRVRDERARRVLAVLTDIFCSSLRRASQNAA